MTVAEAHELFADKWAISFTDKELDRCVDEYSAETVALALEYTAQRRACDDAIGYAKRAMYGHTHEDWPLSVNISPNKSKYQQKRITEKQTPQYWKHALSQLENKQLKGESVMYLFNGKRLVSKPADILTEMAKVESGVSTLGEPARIQLDTIIHSIQYGERAQMMVERMHYGHVYLQKKFAGRYVAACSMGGREYWVST